MFIDVEKIIPRFVKVIFYPIKVVDIVIYKMGSRKRKVRKNDEKSKLRIVGE